MPDFAKTSAFARLRVFPHVADRDDIDGRTVCGICFACY